MNATRPAAPNRPWLAPAAAVLLAVLAPVARAELGAPDPSYREAQLAVRDAGRDTVGHADDVTRLDALGSALQRLARFADAERVFRRALALRPDDGAALAGLGHVALCQQREAEAESLLVRAGEAEGAAADLYLARLRRHDWRGAAAMAADQNEDGRREMLERLAALEPIARASGAERAVIPFDRPWPVPLVRVKLNGQSVLMGVDPGAPELLIDPANARVQRLEIVPGDRTFVWNGSRTSARNAIVNRLELGGIALTTVPAAVTPLHRYSLDVNPQGSGIAGVIGLPVLERLGVTIDFEKQELRLVRTPAAARAPGLRVPYERWGENELVVYGSINGGRRMAIGVGTGLPDAGIGAPAETFDEVGVRPGKFANLVRGMATVAQGHPWAQVQVPTVQVGPVARDRVPGWSGALDSSELWRLGARRDALLGPRFFSGQCVTFDWARHELVIEGN